MHRECVEGDFLQLIHLNGEYIAGFSQEGWTSFDKGLIKQRREGKLTLDQVKLIRANSVRCDIDEATGRIILPKDLIQKAKLGKEIWIVGDGDRLRFYNKEAWEAFEQRNSYADFDFEAMQADMELADTDDV
jgi:DNA-binding transcriptional regulator/RsmH inhibitor MraZ